ncbi:P1 family peptidase [Rhodococcoides kroppenstedtii]|uniref:P1 family peptidase n=1 Tax=Rhodococcoides kroppenstedtii TaxID=293050 RepID=UPI001BDE6E84|nr:P1 family peptidase [Rhodococcus kroppenstedtii]MBT1193205.1 P1 family peptidase [Rhodococcus kroppenstedtii]
MQDRLTDVAGLTVGHHRAWTPDVTVATDDRDGVGWATGTTVVLADGPAVAAVDVRGGGPGTRETDLLDPSHSVQRVDAIVLTGGSAYGLAAADGVMRYLEEHGRGVAMGRPDRVVPIVPAAVIFDLPLGAWASRPDASFGYAAATAAASEFEQGSAGAGTGARAGVLKGGVGTASATATDGPAAGLTVGALVVANPVGSAFDPRTGVLWGDPGVILPAPTADEVAAAAALAAKDTSLNTTIGVVATDADLTASGCRRLAVAAHDGLARAIRPAHSPLDGDTFFALATGRATPRGEAVPVDARMMPDLAVLHALCALAAVVTERAIARAVLTATSIAGIPAYRDVFASLRA